MPSPPTPETLETWLRGPLPDVPPLLQPVAHALLQAREELNAAMHDFPPALLNERPAGVASVGFHLQHLAGVLDRLLTYARRETLTEQQLAAFTAEVPPLAIDNETVKKLVREFSDKVAKALNQLKNTDEASLTEVRGVGRAQVPSTLIGVLVHAAEHTTRHLGQLLVTARVVQATRKATLLIESPPSL
ncbi:DinB family protein [Hymenobacter terricola]|uniref:DinB family protein n=1 Tax=Hymenobacter terricola TaxID=2819236 RepID=UPI001B30EF96|nr:DinB family protein [Hymenobacter terricola]